MAGAIPLLREKGAGGCSSGIQQKPTLAKTQPSAPLPGGELFKHSIKWKRLKKRSLY